MPSPFEDHLSFDPINRPARATEAGPVREAWGTGPGFSDEDEDTETPWWQFILNQSSVATTNPFGAPPSVGARLSDPNVAADIQENALADVVAGGPAATVAAALAPFAVLGSLKAGAVATGAGGVAGAPVAAAKGPNLWKFFAAGSAVPSGKEAAKKVFDVVKDKADPLSAVTSAITEGNEKFDALNASIAAGLAASALVNQEELQAIRSDINRANETQEGHWAEEKQVEEESFADLENQYHQDATDVDWIGRRKNKRRKGKNGRTSGDSNFTRPNYPTPDYEGLIPEEKPERQDLTS